MLNNITIMGRLMRDPELRRTSANTPVLNAAIACTRNMRGRAGYAENDIFNIVAWNDMAEYIAANFQRNSKILIVGHLQNHAFSTQDGGRLWRTEIIVDSAYAVDPIVPKTTDTAEQTTETANVAQGAMAEASD